ncbi:MAG TPA: hypothetical protein VFC00_30890 [Micromonosporaceae bacterium]|nr:hypothetical protein [Micromonosporaceae bacterium]
MNLSPQAWFAIWTTVAFIAVFVALCSLPLLIEWLRSKQFARESKTCEEDEKQWWLLHRIEEDARRIETADRKRSAA